MESVVILLFVLAILLAYFMLNYVKSKPRNLPPGPTGLPIVGSLPALIKDPLAILSEWNKTYGDTIAIQVASRTMVVLHDYDTAKAVFQDENTTGRDQESIFSELFYDKGMLTTEGDLWKEHRRFALASLRDLGMGKGWFETAILEETAELNAVLSSHNGAPLNPHPLVSVAVSNIVGALVFGRRFDQRDVKFQELSTTFSRNFRLVQEVLSLQYFPILRKIPFGPLKSKWKLLIETSEAAMNFAREIIAERSAKGGNGVDNDINNDYITSYMAEKEKQESKKSSSTFSDVQLLVSVRNLFGAGTETTTTTLLWAFVYMVEYPDIQKKVHEEIDDKIGGRTIRLDDKVLLKYTDAVTLEVQRLGSVAPLALVHTNYQAMKIDGYDIPPRTLIHPNTYAIHRNPRYWKHPDTMYPEHFLDASGSIRIPKGFMPFGVGKRECLGEALAKMEVFLMFANILQQFRITYGPKDRPSSNRHAFSAIRSPVAYEICFVSRN